MCAALTLARAHALVVPAAVSCAFGKLQALVWLPTVPRQAIHVGNIRATEGGRELSRYFGEAGLIATSKASGAQLPVRTASIVADEPCMLLVLPMQNYNAFIRLLPGVEKEFAKAKVRACPGAEYTCAHRASALRRAREEVETTGWAAQAAYPRTRAHPAMRASQGRCN